jgi:hypothetical protein
MNRHLLSALCVAVFIGSGAVAQQEQAELETEEAETQEVKLRIGVRADARPFSYESDTLLDVLSAATPGPLARKKFTGYMVKICDAVLNEMIVDPRPGLSFSRSNIEIVEIDKELRIARASGSARDVGGRFRFLVREPGEGAPEPIIDILCDPATINNERRNGLMISPPVYLTGISYVSQRWMRNAQGPGDSCPKLSFREEGLVEFLFGVVGNTNAATSGIRALVTAQEMPQDRDALIQFLRGEDPAETCRVTHDMLRQIRQSEERLSATWVGGPVLAFTTHAEAAQAFCDGEIYYYVGDREIILESVRSIPGCNYENGTRTFTTDRYAIFGRIDYDNPEQAKLVARFFEILSQKILSHPSIMDQAFYDTFHPTQPTKTLDFFFRSVRGSP